MDYTNLGIAANTADNQIEKIKHPKRRRRKNYSLVILTGIMFIVIIFAVLSCTLLFQITRIEVKGGSIYSYEEIAAATGIGPGRPLVTLKTENIGKKIAEDFIYVETVEVKKRFPETVIIEIAASVPVASIDTGEGYLYLSAGGKILERSAEPKSGTLIFMGASLSPDVAPGRVIDITATTNPETGDELTAEEKGDIAVISAVLDITNGDLGGLTEKTDYVDVSDPGDIKIMYDNRIELAIGGLSDIDYKTGFLKQIIDTKIGPNTYGKLMMLSTGGANFIDSDGLKYNEKKFQENKQTPIEETDGTADPDGIDNPDGTVNPDDPPAETPND